MSNPFKEKNSQGRSFKHVAGRTGKDSHSDGGGAIETHMKAKRAHKKGPRPGTNAADRQRPHKQREHKEVKHVDQGDILDEWCKGKRGCYK